MARQRLQKREIAILAIIFAVALALRWVAIGRESLWLDEIASWLCSSDRFWLSLNCGGNTAPLYYPLLHLWIAAFGSSETALRALSVPPSAVSVWLVFRLAEKLLSRRIAYLAAAYQSVSTFQIFYAQEARNYSWLVFFLLLAGWLLWEALEADSSQRRWRCYCGYTLCVALAFYTHYLAVFFVAGHGLFVLFRRPRLVGWTNVCIGTACALISPFAWILVHSPGIADQPRRYLWLKFPQAYFSFLFGDTLVPLDEHAVQHIPETLRANWWILVIALVSATIILVYCWLAWKRWGEGMLYAVTMGSVPVMLAFLVSFKRMFFDERYMIPSSPYVYIAVAAAVHEIILRSRKPDTASWKSHVGMAAIAGYCLLLLLSLCNYYFDPRFGKEQWQEAVSYVESASTSDKKDLLVFDPDYLHWCYRYYQKRGLPIWPKMEPAQAREVFRSGDRLREQVRGYRRVWLVRSHFNNDEVPESFRHIFPQRSFREFPKGHGIEVLSFQVGN